MRDLHALVAEVEPDVVGRPVVDGENLLAAGHALAAEVQPCHVLEALDGLCRAYAGHGDPIHAHPGHKALVVVFPGLQHGVAHNGKGRGLSHPHVPLALIPADERLLLRQLVKAVEVLDLHAIPLEFGPGIHELAAPVHHRLFDAGKDGLLVHELNGQQGGVYLPALDQAEGQLGEGQAVLAPGERHIDRDAVAECVADTDFSRRHHVHVGLYPFYSHTFSPQ